MGNLILRFIKRCFLWTYARNTWQWDVLCVLILAFIFLSPKTWFVSSERQRFSDAQSAAVSTIIIGGELVGGNADKAQLEQRVRELTGRANAQIVGVPRKHDEAGKAPWYEVDIR